ncbi:MAG: anthranilate phosphoribosyltransferase, partial [Candidatus Puniceispirillales bacterium]
NAAAMRAIFSGTENAYRDIVIFNAAAALFGAGHVDNLIKGRDIAVESMESGAALTKLDQLVAVTNREDEK